jgi:hypothetical protein
MAPRLKKHWDESNDTIGKRYRTIIEEARLYRV